MQRIIISKPRRRKDANEFTVKEKGLEGMEMPTRYMRLCKLLAQ